MDIHDNLSPTLPYHLLLSGSPLHSIQYLRRVGQRTSLLNGPHWRACMLVSIEKYHLRVCPKSSRSVQHALFMLLGWFV